MKVRFLILLSSAIVYGIVWSFIYLLFSGFHGMTRMFNKQFIFFIANILNIELNTVTLGLIFAFLDGASLGFLIGIILLKIYKANRLND